MEGVPIKILGRATLNPTRIIPNLNMKEKTKRVLVLQVKRRYRANGLLFDLWLRQYNTYIPPFPRYLLFVILKAVEWWG